MKMYKQPANLNKGVVELMVSKTEAETQINALTLPRQSHTKVWVRCTKCNEEFKREFRNIHKLHSCPTHIYNNQLKICQKCNKYLQLAKFTNGNKLCNKCEKFSSAKTAARKTATGWIKWVVTYTESKCKESNIPFTIDIDYITKQLIDQEGKCFYSNVELTFDTDINRLAMLELLDNSIGYIKGNVVIASNAIHQAKSHSLVDEPINKIKDISTYFCDQPERFEYKIIHEHGKLPNRTRATDAGYDIYSVSDVILHPHKVENVSTGIIVSPPQHYYFTVEGRSSLWAKGIMPFRGIIDATYQGPLIVTMINESDVPYQISVGDRIAQIVPHRIIDIDFVVVNEFTPVEFGRSSNGFGSSGK